MTKTKALEQLLEHSRALIDPVFARKIAKAFGYTLKNLNLVPKKTKEYYRANHTEETAELTSIATFDLAQTIAEDLGGNISSGMHGRGSYAQHITEQAVEYIKKYQARETKDRILGRANATIGKKVFA